MTDRFWKDFVGSADSIRQQIQHGNLRAAFNLIESILVQHGYDFAFELTEVESGVALSFTPEGDVEAAQAIDELVAQRPSLNGWTIYSRRQRKHPKDAVTFVREIYGRDISEAKFEVEDYEDRLRVILVSSAIAGLTEEEARGLTETLLDHLLGEDFVMRQIRSIDERTEPSRPSVELVEISALPERLGLKAVGRIP